MVILAIALGRSPAFFTVVYSAELCLSLAVCVSHGTTHACCQHRVGWGYPSALRFDLRQAVRLIVVQCTLAFSTWDELSRARRMCFPKPGAVKLIYLASTAQCPGIQFRWPLCGAGYGAAAVIQRLMVTVWEGKSFTIIELRPL